MLVKGSEHKWFQISLHIKDKQGPQIDGRVPKDLKIAKLVFARYLPVSVQTQASHPHAYNIQGFNVPFSILCGNIT